MLSPLFTGEAVSLLTATALPASIPIKTPQPTPQKRQGDFFQSRLPPFDNPFSYSAANTTPGNIVAAADIADINASFLTKSLLLFIVLVIIFYRVTPLKHRP